MSNDNRSAEIAADLRLSLSDLPPGTRLPGVRSLAAELHASAATITAALAELSALGLVRTEPGRGTFTTAAPVRHRADFSWQTPTLGRARVDPERGSRLGGYGGSQQLRLSWGYLAPELTPHTELGKIGARVARSPRAWEMTPPAGSPDLRRILAADYDADPQDVSVVTGGQQGLAFAFRTLSHTGDTVLMESPNYPGAILAAQSAGLRIHPVPSDAQGINTHHLAEALTKTGAHLIYLQPTSANPTGVTLSQQRRSEVLALAEAHHAFIIEDDWARHLNHTGPSTRPLFTQDEHGHVVTVFTLAKPISPGLRIGAVIARGPAGERLRAARTAEDLCGAPLQQAIATEFLASPEWHRHRGRLRAALLERRDALVTSLQASLPDLTLPVVPQGGLHLWARLPETAESTTWCSVAETAGILVGDGRQFYLDEPAAPHLRFSFGAVTPAQIRTGVTTLAGVWETQGGRLRGGV